jgi:hypothetical protein
MDFVSDALYDGRRLRALTVVDSPPLLVLQDPGFSLPSWT